MRAEEERRTPAVAEIETLRPDQVKGMCGKCNKPVYSHQPRRKTREGVYIHMLGDGGTDGCPGPPSFDNAQVPAFQQGQMPKPAYAQPQQGISAYPIGQGVGAYPVAPAAAIDGLQNLHIDESGSLGGNRPPTLAQSNFKRLYHQRGSRPDMMMHELFNELQQFLVAHCQDIGVGRDPAIKMLKVLQREAIESVKKYGADNALDSASLARYLWTSGATLEGSDVPREHQVEFCSILNSIIRRDRPGTIKEAVRMVECINSLLVGSRDRMLKNPEEVVVFPSLCNLQGPAHGLPASYRGAGLPIDKLEFYEGLVGKSFRVSGLLATSLSTVIPLRFMDRARKAELPAAMYIITFDPRGKDDLRCHPPPHNLHAAL
jgi:hypothetical protein